jgi:hypothetical protein
MISEFFVFEKSKILHHQIHTIPHHRYRIEYPECQPISPEEISDMNIRKTILLCDESRDTIPKQEYPRQESGISLAQKSPCYQHHDQQSYTLQEHLEEWRREVGYSGDHHRKYSIIGCVSWELLIDPVTDPTEPECHWDDHRERIDE